MKNVKMILSAIAVFAVVGTALAFKAKSVPNLLQCIDVNGTGNFTCELPPIPWSTINNGIVIIPRPDAFRGPLHAPCPTTECFRYNGIIYNNAGN